MTKNGLFLYKDDELVKIDAITSDTHLSHTNIAKYAGRPFDNSQNTYHMDSTLINNWNSVVGENDTVLTLGDIALGDMNASITLYGQANGLKYLIPGNHDGNSSIMLKRYKKKIEKVSEWDRLYNENFIVLSESGVELVMIVDGKEYKGFASHYPPFNDLHHKNDKQDKFANLRPAYPKKNEFVLHGHTHSHDIVQSGYPNVFHMGVDAHDLKPVHSETVIEWFKSYLENI